LGTSAIYIGKVRDEFDYRWEEFLVPSFQLLAMVLLAGEAIFEACQLHLAELIANLLEDLISWWL
jgi:hypothetical protein